MRLRKAEIVQEKKKEQERETDVTLSMVENDNNNLPYCILTLQYFKCHYVVGHLLVI